MMQRGRRIAFDYGDVRIGVATSDADSIICSPYTTLIATEKSLLKKISEILLDIEPVQIFVGKPALLSGKDGASSQKAVEFAESLRGITLVEVVMVDERLSTVSASKKLRDSGKSAKEAKGSIDMAAAVGILEFAIDLEKRK
jgi:putative holliday junction resolvase